MGHYQPSIGWAAVGSVLQQLLPPPADARRQHERQLLLSTVDNNPGFAAHLMGLAAAAEEQYQQVHALRLQQGLGSSSGKVGGCSWDTPHAANGHADAASNGIGASCQPMAACGGDAKTDTQEAAAASPSPGPSANQQLAQQQEQEQAAATAKQSIATPSAELTPPLQPHGAPALAPAAPTNPKPPALQPPPVHPAAQATGDSPLSPPRAGRKARMRHSKATWHGAVFPDAATPASPAQAAAAGAAAGAVCGVAGSGQPVVGGSGAFRPLHQGPVSPAKRDAAAAHAASKAAASKAAAAQAAAAKEAAAQAHNPSSESTSTQHGKPGSLASGEPQRQEEDKEADAAQQQGADAKLQLQDEEEQQRRQQQQVHDATAQNALQVHSRKRKVSSDGGAAPAGGTDEGASSSGAVDGDANRLNKRARMVWTHDLHARFMAAVHQLGVNQAVPKCILGLMGTDGMTRENVASHLQKYRLHLRKLAGVGPNDALPEEKVDDVQQQAMREHADKSHLATPRLSEHGQGPPGALNPMTHGIGTTAALAPEIAAVAGTGGNAGAWGMQAALWQQQQQQQQAAAAAAVMASLGAYGGAPQVGGPAAAMSAAGMLGNYYSQVAMAAALASQKASLPTTSLGFSDYGAMPGSRTLNPYGLADPWGAGAIGAVGGQGGADAATAMLAAVAQQARAQQQQQQMQQQQQQMQQQMQLQAAGMAHQQYQQQQQHQQQQVQPKQEGVMPSEQQQQQQQEGAGNWMAAYYQYQALAAAAAAATPADPAAAAQQGGWGAAPANAHLGRFNTRDGSGGMFGTGAGAGTAFAPHHGNNSGAFAAHNGNGNSAFAPLSGGNNGRGSAFAARNGSIGGGPTPQAGAAVTGESPFAAAAGTDPFPPP